MALAGGCIKPFTSCILCFLLVIINVFFLKIVKAFVVLSSFLFVQATSNDSPLPSGSPQLAPLIAARPFSVGALPVNLSHLKFSGQKGKVLQKERL